MCQVSPRDKVAMTGPKGAASVCHEMPSPGLYWFTITCSGIVGNKGSVDEPSVSAPMRVAVGITQAGNGPICMSFVTPRFLYSYFQP